MKTFLTRVGRTIGTAALLVVTFTVAALIAFVPLTALPGDMQTDWVNGALVMPVGLMFFVILFTLRLSPAAGQETESWWPSTSRLMWRLLSTFVAFFWLAGGCVWLNSYGVRQSRPHNMRVIGYEERSAGPATSRIRHYKLVEIGTSWRADLQPTDARDAFLRVGTCVRITVRRGRLGLDWISDARPIKCPQ